VDDGILSRKCITSFIDGLFWGEVEAQFEAMRIYIFDKEKSIEVKNNYGSRIESQHRGVPYCLACMSGYHNETFHNIRYLSVRQGMNKEESQIKWRLLTYFKFDTL